MSCRASISSSYIIFPVDAAVVLTTRLCKTDMEDVDVADVIAHLIKEKEIPSKLFEQAVPKLDVNGRKHDSTTHDSTTQEDQERAGGQHPDENNCRDGASRANCPFGQVILAALFYSTDTICPQEDLLYFPRRPMDEETSYHLLADSRADHKKNPPQAEAWNSCWDTFACCSIQPRRAISAGREWAGAGPVGGRR